MAQFLNDLLRDLLVLKKAYKPKRKQFDAANLDYHKQLLSALRANDEAAVRSLMHEHMCDAEHHMTALEGQVSPHFCWSSTTPENTKSPVGAGLPAPNSVLAPCFTPIQKRPAHRP
jgi:hypothetical protein